jgi:hypothetical protein
MYDVKGSNFFIAKVSVLPFLFFGVLSKELFFSGNSFMTVIMLLATLFFGSCFFMGAAIGTNDYFEKNGY